MTVVHSVGTQVSLGKWHKKAFEVLGNVEIGGPLVVKCGIDAKPP